MYVLEYFYFWQCWLVKSTMLVFHKFCSYIKMTTTSFSKYLKKLHTQERAVEEVKLAIKPYYQRKDINKEEYKDILRKAVHKVSVSIQITAWKKWNLLNLCKINVKFCGINSFKTRVNYLLFSQICHSRTGEINPVKVSNLVKLYVQRYKYFRKHGRKMDEEEREDREQGTLHSSAWEKSVSNNHPAQCLSTTVTGFIYFIIVLETLSTHLCHLFSYFYVKMTHPDHEWSVPGSEFCWLWLAAVQHFYES